MARVKRVLWVEKLGQKVAGLLLLIALVVLVVGFSSPKYFSANAANWLDQVFGNAKIHSRPSYRRQKSHPISQMRRDAYAIGRADNQLKRVRKKRRLYRIPKAGSSVYAASYKSYRTMCVRTCDGFFFPVSFATSKNSLKKDERACKSSCGAPAELYYYPNPGGEIENMVSFRGNKKYKKLKYAFLYKTKFVASCRCNPEPWTQAAKQTHKKYARIELKKRQKITSRKKVHKSQIARKRAKSRSKGRRYSRRSLRNKRRALRTVGLHNRVRRKSARHTYRVRKARQKNGRTY
ncbi:MAG: DUF2865 domain-containing protein [bacterium]|nr:DUF2865 domain-containing protein [bacterium]